MAYCDKCGNYDESHRDSMDYEKDSHLEAQNYEPDLYYYWDSPLEEDYDWRDAEPNVDCLCEICFDILNREKKIKWKCEKVQPLKCNPIEYKRIMHNFKEFLDYCESFYLPSHPDVLYPIDGLTREELALATLTYLDLCAASDGTISWGDGDSLDRERVRDFVINRRAI